MTSIDRRGIHYLLLAAFIIAHIGLTGCGGEKSTSHTPPPVKPPVIPLPVIDAVYPAKEMISETAEYGNISEFMLVGNYFAGDAVVLVDGHPVATTAINQNLLKAQTYTVEERYPGVHTVQVRTQGGTAKALNYEIYRATHGPRPFDAVEKFFLDDTYIRHIGVGDFDGDGIGEIFAYNFNPYPNNFFVFKRTESGELKLTEKFKTNYTFDYALTGDINGDGLCDVILMRNFNWGGGGIVLTNDGQGHLTETSTLNWTSEDADILLEDVTGDGRKDLLIITRYSRALFLATNMGGYFSSPTQIVNRPYADLSYTRSMPLSLVTGDFNKDGKKDVLYSAYDVDISIPEFRLLLQQSSGLFLETPVNLEGLPAPNDNIMEVAATIDYNRDGLSDIALQINDQSAGIRLNIYQNKGNGAFALVSSFLIAQPPNPSSYALTVGDFNQDGNPDMAGFKDIGIWSENIGNHVIYLWGNGTGEFLSEKFFISNVTSMATGDVSDDGIDDVITGHLGTAISALLGSKTRNLPRPTYLPQSSAGQLSAADVNGDEYLDLMVSDDAHSASGMIYLNDGHGHFAQGISVPAEARIIADLNDDGKAELVGGDDSSLWVWPGIGNPAYPVAPIRTSTSRPPDQLQILDINQDGHMDIFSTNKQKGSMFLYALGNLAFEAGDLKAPNDPYAIGDFNNDGNLDILYERNLYLGDGNGKFSPPYTVNGLEYQYESQYAMSDLNGDGISDIVNNSRIFYGQGDGVFFYQGFLTNSGNNVLTGDYNGDGLSDILFSSNGGFATIFTNDGKGGFLRSFIATGMTVNHMIQADFNNDSKPDIALSGDNAATVILNNYSGSTSAAAFKDSGVNAFMTTPAISNRNSLLPSNPKQARFKTVQTPAKIPRLIAKPKLPVQQKKLPSIELQKKTTNASMPNFLVYSPRIGSKTTSPPAAIDLAKMLNQTRIIKASPVKPSLLMQASRKQPQSEKGLNDLAQEFQNYIKNHLIYGNYALYADYDFDPKDWKKGYVNFVLCDRKGALVIADTQNASHADFQNIKPASIDGCNALLVKRLMQYLR
jgi:hypothetical protein